ncbi:protein moonraker-like isoform X2 [Ostrea edulis]|uniref:protein moonraker-like isoform X2 n=1 Tax=Ostrea edulis TaxID=37623 RepID=UPI0024AFD047|nr:protein moonraker-like isoform X2 [Ostrea edulis]
MAFQNQLQFNTSVPTYTENLAFRHHHPRALIIEKPHVQQAASAFVTRQNVSHVTREVNSSSLSSEKMEMAMKLAQRDIRKQRDQERLRALKPRSRSPSPKSLRTRAIPGQKFWSKNQRSRDPKKERRIVTVREHDKNRQPRDSRTQTPPRAPKFGGRVPDPNFPVSSDSPPSKDTDLKIYPIQKFAPSDQPAKEIERLQREMESYLQQIQVIEQRALKEQSMDFLQHKSRKKKGYLPDEEDRERKQVRSEEMQTRAARQLYVLRQQVREVQNQLIRGDVDKMKHTKKSQIMARLAAAHRGAVRAIQSFVNSLPFTDLQRGLPASYQELALLVRQMSMLSTQLATDEKSSVHQDLLNMLDRVDDLNKAWCSEIQALSSTKPENVSQQKPASRPPFQVPKPVKQTKPTFVSYKGKENRARGVLIARKPSKVTGRTLTPERRATLQAGIAALMQGDKQRNRLDLAQGSKQISSDGMAWEIPISKPQAAQKKSLIIPGKLQAKRDKAQKPVIKSVPETHYADPTVASKLKVTMPYYQGTVLERSFSAPPSPRGYKVSPDCPLYGAWKPAGRTPTTRRARSQSPQSGRQNFMSQYVEDSVVQNLYHDAFLSPNQSINELQNRGRSPTRQRRQFSRSPESMVNEAELAIRTRLKPLLEKAEKIATRQEHFSAMNDVSARRRMANEASNNAGTRGDVLAEIILDDIIRDTAGELENLERSQRAEQEAIRLQDNPTLENVFQRLEQMEQEQFEIRRRWATLEFEEAGSNLRSKRQTVSSQYSKPNAPVAMEITRKSGPSIMGQKNLYQQEFTEDQPIIFTKFRPEPKFVQNRVVQEDEQTDLDRAGGRPVELTLPKNVVENIQNYVEKYERHLKKTSHQIQGKFDPWKLVEEVSDQVLEDCLREVSDELEDINEAVVNQVCKSEFMINSTLNSTPTSPGFTPGASPHQSPAHLPGGSLHQSPAHLPGGSLHQSPARSPGGYTSVTSPDGAVKMVVFSEKDDVVSESQEELTISEEMTEDDDEDDYEDDYEEDYEEDD